MRIAFDLHNLLIVNNYQFPTENPTKKALSKFFNYEKLRYGTTEIFHYCRSQGWETWVYTTSLRSPFYIRRLFWFYNISLNGVVNYKIHSLKVKVKCSKHPPTFKIDLLIDDSEGVALEGKKYNFQVICIAPENLNWVEEIKHAIHRSLQIGPNL